MGMPCKYGNALQASSDREELAPILGLRGDVQEVDAIGQRSTSLVVILLKALSTPIRDRRQLLSIK